MLVKLPRTILTDWDILIVDDDPGSLTLAGYILQYHGARVHTAINGDDGLRQSRQITPKFILSDISMPVMDGWQLLQHLKLDPITHDIPVLALTAHAMPADRTKVLKAGFHSYMTKPINPAIFVRDVLGVLSNIPEIASRLDTEKIKL